MSTRSELSAASLRPEWHLHALPNHNRAIEAMGEDEFKVIATELVT